MKHYVLFLFFFSLCIGTSYSATKVKFFEGTFAELKKKAQKDNRPYFVKFTAAWCMPCRWMDETTFNDPSLAYYVRNNYLAFRIDIDDFDGFNQKKQYNIKLLPSILVFNPDGKVVARYAETLSPSSLIKILKRYEVKGEDKTKRTNVSPSKKTAKNKPIARAPLKKLSPAKSEIPQSYNKLSSKKLTQSGLYRLSVVEQSSEGFSVQVGMFSDYANVIRETSRFQEMFYEPVVVYVYKRNGKVYYKILIGVFKNKDKALLFKKEVLQKGFKDVFVKDLSTLEF